VILIFEGIDTKFEEGREREREKKIRGYGCSYQTKDVPGQHATTSCRGLDLLNMP
jgi:hypothetical protein